MFQAQRYSQFALVALAIAFTGSEAVLGEETAEAQTAPAAPLPTLLPSRLREETLGYNVSVSMAGGEQSGEAELSLAKDWLGNGAERQEVWRLEFRELGPLPRSNAFVLRGSDLGLLERRVTMPIGGFRLRFGAETVGVAIGETDEPEELPLPTPVLANWDVAVLALPLAEGFETSAHTFEFTQQTVHSKAAVVAVEAVETPAGVFDSYKVALTCLDNDAFSATVWVSKDAPYRIVRRESVYMPEMAAGNMLIELARIGDAAEE